MGKVLDYFREVRLELSKVVWPKRKEVVKLTSIVFIISALVALYAGVLDYILTKTLELVIAR